MSARADFECVTCQLVWQDLPVTMPVCPGCGEGGGTWRRLFNMVQVSTRGHRIAKFVDRTLGPQLEAHQRVLDRRRAAERELRTAADRAWERATPDERAAQVELGIDRERVTTGISAIPATGPGPLTGAALLARDPSARADSARYTAPILQALRVRPIPVK